MKYLTSANVENGKLPANIAYISSATPEIIGTNNKFISLSLVNYFSATKNIEILNLYSDIKKQHVEIAKKAYDTDDTSSSKTPKTLEKTTNNINQIDPKDVLVSVLSAEILGNKTPFVPMELYHLPYLSKQSNFEQFSSLPNQIKALIKYYDYLAEEAMQTYKPTSKNVVDADLHSSIINKVSQGIATSLSGYVYINFLNLKEVQVFEGYELTPEGEVLMNKPIYSKLESYRQLNRQGMTLCRLMDYKNLKFNIPETGYFPTYNEHFFIGSKNRLTGTQMTNTVIPAGTTAPSISASGVSSSPSPTGGTGY